MRRGLAEEERRELATRVADALRHFAGTLHAARGTMVIWLEGTANPSLRHASKYGLQLAFGAIALTMRKFEDLWSTHMPELIPDRSQRPEEGKAIVKDCQDRNLRNTANQLIAHYADERGLILAPSQIETLIRSNGWETEEEVVKWVEPVIEKILRIEEKIRRQYGVQGASPGGSR